MVGKNCALICAYNEEAAIGKIISETKKYVDGILVVNDGSTDRTSEIARDLGVDLIEHKGNLGKGQALKNGLAYLSESDYNGVITLDADGQHLPEEIPRFTEKIQNYDVLIGQRDFDTEGIPKGRKYGNKFDAFMWTKILKQDIKDPQNGFRMFRRDSLNEMLNLSTNSGFPFELETLAKMVRNDFSIGWVPISTIYEDNIESHINPVKHTIDMCKLYWKAWRGKI